MTDVLNTETGEILTFDLSPVEAVRSAFCLEKSMGAAHHSEYLPAEAIVKEIGNVLYAGDFCAMKE